MAKTLPQFQEWTVDVRLKEFRKVDGQGIDFLSFESDEGCHLLSQYIETVSDADLTEILAALL